MEPLDCHVQTYEWGKHGDNSEVALLFAAGHKKFRIDPNTAYAELWMGTHHDGAAVVRDTSEPLSQYISRKESTKNLLNNNNKSKMESHLPSIMKIMSIQHTLSLQVHPTKEQAARLHEKDPKHYPDRNHKPELAYALTRFELLCGFRPAEEIMQNMEAFPELKEVMGVENSKRFKELVQSGVPQESEAMKKALRECFINMMNLKDKHELVEEQLVSLKHKLIKTKVRGCLLERTVEIMLDTFERFPSDVGCFAPLYLNHMILEPGQCCYYAAQELHAYLSGECVECVGCSNNTIRAGLTPKYVDRPALIDVLNYRMTDPSYYLVPRVTLEKYPHVAEYEPCEDFTLHEIKISTKADLPTSQLPAALPVEKCGSIVVIVKGEAVCESGIAASEDDDEYREYSHTVKRGDIFYIPPECSVRFTSLLEGTKELVAYRTHSYAERPDHSQLLEQPTAVPSLKKSNGADYIRYEPISFEREHIKFKMGAEVFDPSVEMDGFL
jgi:mannose-6-phosphate isomerase